MEYKINTQKEQIKHRAIITADIVNSSTIDKADWSPILQAIQLKYGAEVYRGDSFQLRCENLNECIYDAIHIKAAIKSLRNLDVRMSIGIGEEIYLADSVAESSGSAYERSGKGLDKIDSNKKDLIAFDSGNPAFDLEINTILDLLNVVTTGWKPKQAKAMERLLRNGKQSSINTTQKELAGDLGIKGNTLSTQFSQANKKTVMNTESLLNNKLLKRFSVSA